MTIEKTIRAALDLGPMLPMDGLPVTVRVFRKFWDLGDFQTTRVDYHDGLTLLDLIPEDLSPEMVTVFYGDDAVMLEHLAETRVVRGDSVVILAVPMGEGFVIGAVKFIASLLVSYIIGRLLSPSPDARDPNDTEGTFYGFDGIGTEYNVIGLPVPVVYGGPIDVGGRVVFQNIDVEQGAEQNTFLYIVLLLSAGPIDSIGQYTTDQDGLTGDDLPDGMKINGNNAKNYDDVEVSLRLGSRGQDVVPGFDVIPTIYAVGLIIDNEEIGSATPPFTDFSTAAVFDMPAGAIAERCKLLIRFAGLYTVSAGSFTPRTVPFEVRYIELDSFGNPTGSYVNVDFNAQGGSGTTFNITAASSSSITRQIEFPVIDPDTFVPPGPGNALIIFQGRFGLIPITTPLSPRWSILGIMDSFSIFAVIARRSGGVVPDATQIIGHINGTDGWSLDIDSLGILTFHYRVDGFSTSISSVGSPLPAGVFASVAVTYGASTGGGSGTVNLYITALKRDAAFATGLRHPASGNNMVFGAGISGAVPIDIDDLRIYDTELSQSDVTDLHNGKAWFEGGSDEAGVVWGSHFQSSNLTFGGGFYTTPAYIGDDITWSPPLANVTVTPGAVVSPASGGTRSLRIRVETQRTTAVAVGTQAQDEAEFLQFIGILDEEVAYTGWAVATVKVRATDQLNTNRPDFRLSIKGRNDLPIWDGLDEENPTFTPGFSRSPSWQLAGFCLDPKYGGGDSFTVDDFDWQSMRDHADWAETNVWDQRGRFTAFELGYAVAFAGFAGAVFSVLLTKPIPNHFSIGATIKVSAVGDPEYPSGEMVIGAVVSLTNTTYALVFDWPDGMAVPSVNPFTDAAAAVTEGLRPRIACNIVLDERGVKFWDAVHLFTAVGRTSPSRAGNVMRLPINTSRQPTAVIGPSNIVLESFQISASRPGEQFSVAIAEINDETQGFERNSIPRTHPSLSGSSTRQRITKTFEMKGVTDPAQARVELDLLLNLNQGDKLWVTFDGLMDSFFMRPGEVFALAFPVPWNRYGGRVERDAFAPNVLDESEDFTTWNVGTDADAPLATATAPPFGDGAVYLMSSKSGATSFALWSRDAGVFPADTILSTYGEWVKEGTSPSFELKLRDETLGVPHAAEFDWTAGVPVEASVTTGVITRVTDGTTLTPPTPAGWYFVEMLIATPASAGGNARRVYFYTPKTSHGGSWPNQDIEACYAMVQENTPGIAGGWARAQTFRIDIPITIEAGKSYSMAVRNDKTDAVSIVTVDGGYPVGEIAAGTFIRLDEYLGFNPTKGATWVFGESALSGSLFQVIGHTKAQGFKCRIEAVTYDAADYPDPDAIVGIGETEAIAAASILGSLPGSRNILPEPSEFLAVKEEARKDLNSGVLQKSIAVSWSPAQSTSHLIARTNVWIRNETTVGSQDEFSGVVDGAGGLFRITDANIIAGVDYSVAIQEVSMSGEKRSLAKASRVTFTARAAYPVPLRPFTVTIHRIGRRVVYRWALSVYEPGSFIEIRRGGVFVGDRILMVPAILRQHGPTMDWALLDADSLGVSSPKLFARVVLANEIKGEARVIENLDSAIPTQGEEVKSLHVQDTGWGNAFSLEAPPVIPVEADTLAATAFEPESLIFNAVGSATEFTYQSSTVTMDYAREVHVSFAIEGYQFHPKAWETFEDPYDGPEYASWTWEGPTDPNDPDFDEVTTRIDVDWDDDASGGSDGWEHWSNGTIWAKILKWRLVVSRPDDTWDVQITRAAIRVAELDPRDLDGGVIT